MTLNLWHIFTFLSCQFSFLSSTSLEEFLHSKRKDLYNSVNNVHLKLLDAGSVKTYNKNLRENLDYCTKVDFFDTAVRSQISLQTNMLPVSYGQSYGPRLIFSLNSTISEESRNITDFRYSFPCSIVTYSVHSLSSLDVIDSLWIYRFPGGVYESFHLIFVLLSQNENESKQGFSYTRINTNDHSNSHDMNPRLLLNQVVQVDMTERIKILELMHNFLIIIPKQSSEKQVVLQVFSTERSIWTWTGALIRCTAVFDPDKAKLNTLPNDMMLRYSFESRWHNMKQEEMIVAATPEYNEDAVERYQSEETFDTPTIPYFQRLFTYVNASIGVAESYPPVYGTKIFGAWVGSLGIIAEEKGHLTVPMGITQYDRSEVVFYSTPAYFDTVIFLSGTPQLLKTGRSIRFLGAPLSSMVWLCIMLSILLIVFTLKMMSVWMEKRKNNFNYHPPQRFTLDVLESLIWTCLDQPAAQSSYYSNNPHMKTVTVKSIIGLWLISLIVLSCAYKSKLISAMVRPSYFVPPDTFAKLAQSDYKIGGVMYEKGLLEDRFRGLHNNIGDFVRRRTENYEIRDSKCFLRVLDENFVCMGYGSFLRPFAVWFLTDINGRKLYKYSNDFLFPTAGSIGYSKNFPHISRQFDKVTGLLCDAGMAWKWFDQVLTKFQGRGKIFADIHRNPSDEDSENSKKKSIMVMSQTSLYLRDVMLIGCGVSTLLFVLEMLAIKILNIYFCSTSNNGLSKLFLEPTTSAKNIIIVSPNPKLENQMWSAFLR